MNNYTDNATAIAAVLSNYFEGIFKGDVALLRSTFYPQALVVGDINGQTVAKSLDEYLEGVKNRKSPFELGENFRMEILAIESINSITIAKVRVPIFDFNYYDLLSLSKVDGAWVIVNKLFTNVTV